MVAHYGDGKGPGEHYLPSDLAIAGPLGMANSRNNKGRSVMLGGRHQRASVVLSVSAPQLGHRESVGDALAQTATVSLSYRDGLDNASHPLRVQGVLEWGTDGHQVAARFDWVRGTLLRPCGSSFRVVAEIVPDPYTPDPNPHREVLVGGVIGYTMAGRREPTLTDYRSFGEGSTLALRVPAFASGVRVLAAPASYSTQWFADDALAVALTGVLPGSDIPAQVPGGANYLAVTASGRVAVVWLLDL